MLNPQTPASIGPMAQLSDVALRSLLTATHYALAQKLPLPEADREQWCMRLDSQIRHQNEMAVVAGTCAEWERERRRQFVEKATAAVDPKHVLEVHGKTYADMEAVQISADLRGREFMGMQTTLSLSALLVLDERARQAAAATPVVCWAGAVPVPLVVTPNPGPPVPESELTALIRRERDKPPAALLPAATLP